ncbi:hypothetical protein TSTA_006150 [Talaromyces stipitatus ATCC 10500]|uniref:BZIP transcription factor n=1 Tax=Talaromyces stipitatus (strain ATCC 10500 / CBS 375.48 / QM 6759 / NRRL 1006) TaxID=441959 RepID=B8MTX2_TALSN|nr:uncharacterized protein TSTA_006150 [Talaromyces stipitatus ATCC 10500]EED12586.1 hypothetical protein TSTA_006150 [Talaromyces stipitatus ATCC 10500]
MSLSPIDIISSSSYPIPERFERGRIDSNILYGGLTLVQNEDTTRPSTPKAKSKRDTNKQGTSKSNDTKVSKRKRGRPRVLDKDENAAERRRTQIRLAQRAYRSRKEATISSLSQRLSVLDAAIREMNVSVGNFRNVLVGSGLLLQQTPVTYGFQKLLQKSDALMKLAKESSDYATANGSPVDESASNHSSLGEGGDALLMKQSPQISEDLEEFNFLLYGANDNASSMDVGSLFQGYDLDTVNQQQPPTTQTDDPGMQMISSYSTTESYPNSTSWLQHNIMPTPLTYSHNESSLARRLARQCAEYGYRLLTDPNTDPKDILYTYRFSLSFRSKQALTERFWNAITSATLTPNAVSSSSSSSNSSANTSYSTTPRYTLGNAGMHYSRLLPGNQTPPTATTNLYPFSKFIGPWPFHQGALSHDCTTLEEIVAARGMGGEWFDSNDVEGYIREKGIHVNTHASFVTLPESSVNLLEHLNENENERRGDLIDPSLKSVTLSSQDVSKDTKTKKKRQSTVIFDVDMFLKELISRGVCLADKAGYRKEDVEECFRISCYSVA